MCDSSSTGESNDLRSLPVDLPVPRDDGSCDHLLDLEMPELFPQNNSRANRELRIT